MALIDFVIDAKLSGYADDGGGNELKFEDGSSGFEYASDDYRYLDRYYGFNPFSGTEHVYDCDGVLIWKMNYYGEVSLAFPEPARIYSFLKIAMSSISPAYPFRGPANLENDSLRYENQQHGTLENFHGTEKIYSDKEVVYVLRYHGGTMIRKA